VKAQGGAMRKVVIAEDDEDEEEKPAAGKSMRKVMIEDEDSDELDDFADELDWVRRRGETDEAIDPCSRMFSGDDSRYSPRPAFRTLHAYMHPCDYVSYGFRNEYS